MQSEKRILWIDVARGIAILLVIMGHCIGVNVNEYLSHVTANI